MSLSMGYLRMLSVLLNDSMRVNVDFERIKSNRRCCNRDTNLAGLNKTTKSSVSVTGTPDDIRTKHLSN